jgi:hypothetical protein
MIFARARPADDGEILTAQKSAVLLVVSKRNPRFRSQSRACPGFDRHSGLHLLNVQTDQFFIGELIPGSRRVPLDTIAPGAPDLPKDAAIVTYCASLVFTELRGRSQARGTRVHERAYLP